MAVSFAGFSLASFHIIIVVSNVVFGKIFPSYCRDGLLIYSIGISA
jgi:hypothetical protein